MDESGTPQQPGQTPQAPPAAPPQQQPAAQPPAYGAPQQPGQPPSSKKPLVIVLIVIAVVVILCGLLACGVAAVAIFDSGPSIEEIAAEADPHYEAAAGALEDVDTYYDAFADVEGDDAETQRVELLDEANALIAQARNDAAEAQVLVETLDESPFRSEYLDALALMNQSLDAYESMYADQQAMETLEDDLDAMMADLRAADDQLDNSVDLTNSRDYAKAKTDAEAARAMYEEAAEYFNTLAETYPELEFELQVTVERHLVDAATAAIKAAEAGSASDNSAYQKHVAAYDAAYDKVDAAPGPYWIDDWSLLWTEFDASYDQAWAYYEESLAAWERAGAELGADEE